jgi:hypothetical protein
MKKAAEEFLDLAIEKLDPEMRRNDICQLREAAIQTREILQAPSPSGFRIPTHGSYWEDMKNPVRYLMMFSTKDPAQSKIVLSYFQALWPEADATSLRLYLNKGWTAVGMTGRGEVLLISKRDFKWVIAICQECTLRDSHSLLLPIYGD